MAGFHSVTTFRTLGVSAVVQALFSLENGASSGVNLQVRRLTCQMDSTVGLPTWMPIVRTTRTVALPTGGTTLTKAPWDTGVSSAATVVARGATASDGGGATAITAVPDGGVAWQQLTRKQHTLAEQVLSADANLLPDIVEDPAFPPFLIRQGQALLVEAISDPASANPNTNHWFVSAAWDEVTA